MGFMNFAGISEIKTFRTEFQFKKITQTFWFELFNIFLVFQTVDIILVFHMFLNVVVVRHKVVSKEIGR